MELMSNIPDTKMSKVIWDCMILRCSIIADFIFRLGHVHRRGNVVGESTVLIKVDDQQTMRVNILAQRIRSCTHALSQYFERRSASYRCLIIGSPEAMGLVGCIESMVTALWVDV